MGHSKYIRARSYRLSFSVRVFALKVRADPGGGGVRTPKLHREKNVARMRVNATRFGYPDIPSPLSEILLYSSLQRFLLCLFVYLLDFFLFF